MARSSRREGPVFVMGKGSVPLRLMADRSSAGVLGFGPDRQSTVDRRLSTDIPVVLRLAFVVMAACWAVALPLATFLVSRPRPGSASYSTALVLYALASKVCHQVPARSFALWGTPMPVCARCAGIYFAGAVTSLALSTRHARSIAPPIARTMLLASLLPGALTLFYEWTTGVAPANWIRAASGLPIGAAVSWLVLGAVAVDRRSDEVN
jgi:uncharacterized membrane protein